MSETDEKYIGPFWGAPIRYSTGRDHLGMQATSVATYSYLVPGLTNLTQRARYFSYYPWLVDKYAEKVHSASRAEFNKFIRRGELLYAFVSILDDPEQRAVVGSFFVRSYVKENGEPSGSTVINIAEYADIKKGKKTYWQLHGGGFTQYYLGPLREVGILREGKAHGLPVVTEIGKQIAENFEKSIGDEAKAVILSAITKGTIKYSDIVNNLTVIMPDKIRAGGREANYLIEHLIPKSKDDRGVNRKETFLSYMSYLKQDKISDFQYDLPRAIYYKEGNGKKALTFTGEPHTLYGWYFYQVSEYVHFALEYMLFYLLRILHDNGGWIPVDDCVEQIGADVLKQINNILPNVTKVKQTTTIQSVLDSLKTYRKTARHGKGSPEWLKPSKDSFDEENLAKAILLLLVIYLRHEEELEELSAFGWKSKTLRDGNHIEILQYCKSMTGETLESFIRQLTTKKVISRHLDVSYRKMKTDEKNTLKFQYENASLSGLEVVIPVMTSPRLNSMMNFMKDLSLVDADNKLTTTGQNILNDRA